MVEHIEVFAPTVPRTVPARIVVVETINHQEAIAQPHSCSNRFSRECETHEEPYGRRFVVGEEWEPLDLGWLAKDGAGMIVLRNREGEYMPAIPTPEAKAELALKVVELCVVADCGIAQIWLPFAVIRPGESCRFEPSAKTGCNLYPGIHVRCKSGKASCGLTAFPR